MSELKVGFLTLLALVGTVFLSVKVTQNQSGFGDYVGYKTVIDDAAGVFEKTSIKVAGINAGRIKSIELSGNQALINFEVLKEVKITKDSILKIKSVGFLGDKYLEIIIGQAEERMKEGSFIPSNTGGGLEDLSKDASEVLKDLKAIVKNFKETMAPKDKDGPLQEIVRNVKNVTQDAREVAASLRRVIGGNEGKFNAVVANIEEVSRKLRFHTDAQNKEALLADLKKIGPVLQNARDASDDLKLVIADIKAGRGTVGKLLRDEQVVDQVSETLSGVNKLVNKVDSIQTELAVFTAYNSEEDSKSDISLSIIPSPERFYLLGISTAEFGPEEEKQITEVQGGTTTVTTRKELDKDTFRFNIQVGRKVHNWSFRAGLIESSGGLGIDYSIPSWSTKLTFEAFDYEEDVGPNLRFLAYFHLWNVFYAKIGGEDLVSKVDEQSLTVGAGLKFTDEDLKSLIGFFL